MKASEVLKLINEIEKKFPVQDWTINGVHVWPFLRIKLFSETITYYNFSRPSVNTLREKSKVERILIILAREFKGLGHYIKACMLDRSKNEKLATQVDVILLSDGVSYTKLEKGWYERFCDPIREQLDQGGQNSVLLSPSYELHVPRYYKSYFFQPIVSFIVFIKFRFLSDKGLKTNLDKYEECIEFLRSKDVPALLCTQKRLQKAFKQIFCLTDFYKEKIELLKPKFCMQVSYYSILGYSLNLACYQKNIPCVDIQHGVQGKLHVAYGQWNNVPRTGYELLPSIFWCWTDLETNTINEWADATKGKHKAITGGNLFLENSKLLNKDLLLSLAEIKSKLGKFDAHIIYSLNGFESSSDIDKILDLVGSSADKYFWWLRCHPCFLQKNTAIKESLLRRNILNAEVDVSTEQPLYSLLPNMDIHVTECSSSVIEARMFGVPSVVTTEYGAEYYNQEISSGWAIYADSKAKILASVDVLLKNKHKRLSLVTEHFDLNMGLISVMSRVRSK